MAAADQVAVIYAGVRGHLDNIEPSKITAFEEAYLKVLKASHQDVLDTITAEKVVSPGECIMCIMSFMLGKVESAFDCTSFEKS